MKSELTAVFKLCKNCKFYNPIYANDQGECRRSPPIRLPRQFTTEATAGNRVRNEELLWGFPLVATVDWCGKFKRGKKR